MNWACYWAESSFVRLLADISAVNSHYIEEEEQKRMKNYETKCTAHHISSEKLIFSEVK